MERAMSASKKIGDIEVTTVSDGVLAAPLDVVLGMEKTEVERLVRQEGRHQLSRSMRSCSRLNGKWALVDTGSGNTMGPTLGKLPDNLRALGVAPEKIETIFLTHLHPDHSNGLVDDAGHADLSQRGGDPARDRSSASGSIATRRAARTSASAATSPRPRVTTAPYRKRMRTVRDGEAVPGVSALLLAGHTPGHTGWLIQSGKDGLLIWGDVVHLAVDPDPASRHRARLRRRSAGGVRDAQAHVRPRRRRQADGRRHAPRFSRLRPYRAHRARVRVRAGCVTRTSQHK